MKNILPSNTGGGSSSHGLLRTITLTAMMALFAMNTSDAQVTHHMLTEKKLTKFERSIAKKIKKSQEFKNVRKTYDVSTKEAMGYISDDIDFLVGILPSIIIEHHEFKEWMADGLNLSNIIDFLLYDLRTENFRIAAEEMARKLIEYETEYTSQEVTRPIEQVFAYPNQMGPDYQEQGTIITDAFASAMTQAKEFLMHGTADLWFADQDAYTTFKAENPDLFATKGSAEDYYYVTDTRVSDNPLGGYAVSIDMGKHNTEGSGSDKEFISKRDVNETIVQHIMYTGTINALYNQYGLLIDRYSSDMTDQDLNK